MYVRRYYLNKEDKHYTITLQKREVIQNNPFRAKFAQFFAIQTY